MISGELYIEENGSYLRVDGGAGAVYGPPYRPKEILWHRRISNRGRSKKRAVERFSKVTEDSPDEAVIESTEKPKRRKKQSGRTTEFLKVRPLVLERDGFRCTKCGCPDNLHVHHIKEKSKGGSNELSNLITLCRDCHAEEHKEEPVYRLMTK